MSTDANVAEKIARYQQFLKQDPLNIKLTIDLVELLCQTSRAQDAVDLINDCPASVQEHTSITLKKCEAFLLLRDFSSAQTLLQQKIEVHHELSQHMLAHHMLGLCFFYQERYFEAITSFENSVSHSEATPQNWKYLAYSHHHLNQLTDAIEYAYKWVEKMPDADSLGYLAVILFDLGDLKTADEYAQKAIKIDPEQSDAHVITGSIALSTGQLQNATKDFQVASKRNPNNGRAWLGLGLIALAQHTPQDARILLERAKNLMPKHIGTSLALGWLKFKLGEVIQAQSEFTNALGLDRNFAESHGALACTHIMLDQPELAEQHITLAKKLDPHNFASAYAQVLQLKKQGKHNDAEILLGEIMRQRPPQQSMTLTELVQSFTNPAQ